MTSEEELAFEIWWKAEGDGRDWYYVWSSLSDDLRAQWKSVIEKTYEALEGGK
jgi:hypothetical protein